MKEERWIPRIVGGTDYDGGDQKVMPRRTRPQIGIANEIHRPRKLSDRVTGKKVIETTHEQLCEYTESIPDAINVSWDYGPVQTVPDGTMVLQGQYVTEYHDGKEHQVYWIPC